MSTATVAEGIATDATARPLSHTGYHANVRNALRLLDQTRQQIRDLQEQHDKAQVELIDILDTEDGSSYLVTDVGYRKHFTVVRAHGPEKVEHDEALALRVIKKLRMYKRFTRTVIDWNAVRSGIDSGLFPELDKAVVVTPGQPKRPYIKIS